MHLESPAHKRRCGRIPGGAIPDAKKRHNADVLKYRQMED